MGGKSSGQVAGYRYFGNLVVMIGNRIEELKAINFDKRGWQINDEQKVNEDARMFYDGDFEFTLPSIYGEDEGGVAGKLGVRLGYAETQADEKYAEYLASKSFPALTYPYLSYLVFKGRTPPTTTSITGKKISVLPLSESGFYFGNNPFLKEMMLWVKRTRVRNDGRQQWYMSRADGAIVCEIGANVLGSSQSEYESKINNLPPLLNKWYGTSNVDDQYHEMEGKGLSPQGVWEFASQYGYIGKKGYVKTTFPAALQGLVIKLTVFADDGLTGLTWTGGKVKTLRTYSEQAYPDCRDMLLYCESTSLNLHLEITDGVNGGSNSNHKVVLALSLAGFGEVTPDMEGIDINPIHKIREILTDDTAMGIPESEINDELFIRAANQIYDEELGISCAFTEKNCKEAIDEICSHIEAGVRVNRQTGKYEVVLFRDDWLDLEDVLHFDKTNIKRDSFSVEVMNTDDAINVLNVNYYDRANIKDSSFNVYENGLIQTIGHENAETVEFPYFMNQRNAEIVANWKLKQLSTPAWKGSFVTSSRAARKLNRYDVIALSWASKQIVNLPVRVMKINLGTTTDTAVMIEFIEVVPYSNANYSNIVVDGSVSQVLPPQPASPTIFEVPYYALVQLLGQREADARILDNPELGYAAAAQEKPQSNSLNAMLYTDGGTGVYTDFDKVGVVDYCDGVYLDQPIGQMDTAFLVADLDYVQNGAPKFTALVEGTIGQLNDELVSFVSYDIETKLLTVKRGILDTIPKAHTDGKITFWGEAFGYDTQEYVLGEEVGVQVLTTTPSGVDSLNVDAVKTVEIQARAIRPYPPANVKINGEYWLSDAETSLVLTWVDRNRLQQTGGNPLSWFDDGVAAESGTTYLLKVYEIDEALVETEMLNLNVGAVNTHTVDLSTALPTTKQFKVVLKSMRDGYESFTAFEHIVSTAFSAPYNLVAEYVA